MCARGRYSFGESACAKTTIIGGLIKNICRRVIRGNLLLSLLAIIQVTTLYNILYFIISDTGKKNG